MRADPGYNRIAFSGLPAGSDADTRIFAVKAFFERHTPKVSGYAGRIIYRGSSKDKNRNTTTASEFHSNDTMR